MRFYFLSRFFSFNAGSRPGTNHSYNPTDCYNDYQHNHNFNTASLYRVLELRRLVFLRKQRTNKNLHRCQ